MERYTSFKFKVSLVDCEVVFMFSHSIEEKIYFKNITVIISEHHWTITFQINHGNFNIINSIYSLRLSKTRSALMCY